MRYTDIVKARALRRAGRACEMCGTPVSFDSAQFISAQPIFGILFDQDDCCVLCGECLTDLDPETRAVAERGPANGLRSHEARPDPVAAETKRNETKDTEEGLRPQGPERSPDDGPSSPTQLLPGAREAWFPKRDPDGDMCA